LRNSKDFKKYLRILISSNGENICKVIITALLFLTLCVLPIIAMEEQNNVSDLLKILTIKNPTDLFYEALLYIKKYKEEEIETLEIDSELKTYALKLKQEINKKLFWSIITDKDKAMEVLLNFGANINAQDGCVVHHYLEQQLMENMR